MIRKSVFGLLLGAIILGWPLNAYAFRYIAIGDPAPSLTIENVKGEEVKISLSGKITVVVFWRKGQIFSLEALRDLEKVSQNLRGKGVEIFAIAENPSSPGEIREVIEKNRLSYPFFLDRSGKAEEQYGIIVLPSTGIIGKDGRLAYYQPSRNHNYQEIIEGKLKVVLGMMTEGELETKLTSLGESFGEARERAQELYKESVTLSKEGKTEEAIRDLAQAINLAPSFLEAHVQLGYLLIETGNASRALKEFEYVLERSPRATGARTGIGIAYARMGNLDRAVELLKEAININPNPVRAYYELGKVYEAKGELDNALHYYKWAIRKLLQGRR